MDSKKNIMSLQAIVNNGPIQMDLNEIDERPGPYTMSFAFDLNRFIQSIKDIGLINPPFVKKSRGGRMDVVMGYRRIMALKSIGWKRAPVFDLTHSGIPTKELFLCNLHENLVTRSFNYVERGMILKRLTSYFSDQEIHDSYLPLLGVSSSWEMDLILRLEELDKDIKGAVAQNKISLKVTRFLLEMDDESRSSIFMLISSLNLNLNQQMQLIEYMNDISIRDEQNIRVILSHESFIKIQENNNLNNPQKTKKLFALLHTKRYPHLTQTEETFKKMIAEMNLPNRVRIVHPPYFEAPDYKMEILFKGGQELKMSINKIAKIDKLKDLSDPWDQDL